MNIALEKSGLLSGDMVLSAILRTDMAPIPSTFEGVFNGSSDIAAQLQEGRVLQAGHQGYHYRIIKSEKSTEFAGAQGSDVYPPISVTALYDPCHKVAFRRKSAVIKENSTLANIYRACGAQVQVDSDFTIAKFACLVGGVPSMFISQALQEESGVIVLRKNGLKFMRLGDVLSQEPKITVHDDLMIAHQSGFLERHEIPFYYSLDESGGSVFGNRNKERTVRYIPRTDVRILKNMTRVLVKKGAVRLDFAAHINAGDVIRVGKTPLAVLTAAHVYKSGTTGEAMESYSKFWLGEIEE